MLLIPNDVFNQYVVFLNARGISASLHGYFKKWLRYYLDFCDKYPVPEATADRVRLFCEKLQDKGQSKAYQEQAAFAVSVYYEMIRQEHSAQSRRNSEQSGEALEEVTCSITGDSSAPYLSEEVQPEETQLLSARRSPSQYTEAGYQEKSKSPEWDEVLAVMAAEIKVRHYSRKTLKTYANWSRNFQRFLKDKPPRALTDDDVKEYLPIWR